LITYCQNSANFFAIDKICDKLFLFNITFYYHFMECLISFTNKVDGRISNFHWSEWNISEFNSFIHHTHGSKECSLNIVFDILSSYFSLLHKRWVLCAWSHCKYRRVNIIIVQGKFNITWWYTIRIYSNLDRRFIKLSMNTRSKESF